MTNQKYQVEDRETGNCVMGEFATLEEAINEVDRQEQEDKVEGQYESDWYAIRDLETDEMVDF